MIKEINTYPEHKEILSTPCATVEPVLDSPMSDNKFWGPQVTQMIENLKDTAQANKERCLGLCANQIWEGEAPAPAIFVSLWPVTTEEGKTAFAWREFINPTVISNGPTVKLEEGCLSLPNRKPKMVRRKSHITVSYYDLKSDKPQMMKLSGKAAQTHARIIQHEYDHILGKII
jgi:peptide deformylase